MKKRATDKLKVLKAEVDRLEAELGDAIIALDAAERIKRVAYKNYFLAKQKWFKETGRRS